ncbi:MAG: hypothetical protein KGI69_01540 [Patescibacteria group bacterium]|nr:hypothetical protein [Patescibacteria group bacterium]
MNRKTLIWIGLFAGSTVGGSIPLIWGGGFLSFSSIVLSAAGGLAGIWAGFRLADYI